MNKNQVIPAPGTAPALVRWGGVIKPDRYGNFYVDVELTPEQAEPLIEEYQSRAKKVLDEAIAEAKGIKKKALAEYREQLPIKPDYDQEGEPTGKYRMVAKLNAAWESKKTGASGTNSVLVCDATGQVLRGVDVGWNSEVYVSVKTRPYIHDASEKYGVKMELVGVQIISLGDTRPQDAASAGFGVVEGGFQGQPVAAPAEETPAPAASAAEAESGDADY
jgi:hypothetical protein